MKSIDKYKCLLISNLLNYDYVYTPPLFGLITLMVIT